MLCHSWVVFGKGFGTCMVYYFIINIHVFKDYILPIRPGDALLRVSFIQGDANVVNSCQQ